MVKIIYYYILSLIYRSMPNGCEVDITVPEDFPPDALMDFIEAFINVIIAIILLEY
jgi:hypothetical protein